MSEWFDIVGIVFWDDGRLIKYLDVLLNEVTRLGDPFTMSG